MFFFSKYPQCTIVSINIIFHRTTMIKDCLQSLEDIYHNMKETKDGDNNISERASIISHADCLLQGVQSKVYKPLLKRQTCCKYFDTAC